MRRPEDLFPLFSDLTALEGVGPKSAGNFEGLGVTKPKDLLFVLPYAVTDRRKRESVVGLDGQQVATVEVTVGKHQPAAQKGRPYRIVVEDSEVAFQIVFFHARQDYLKRQ